MAKLQPAVQTMQFTIPAGSSLQFIDLSKNATLLNRRFYRQGLQWAVAGFTLHASSGETVALKINKLPTTWMVSNAWEKGFRVWDKMNKIALAENPSLKPKWYDFKLWMSDGHFNEGDLFCVDPHGNTLATFAGEWIHSHYSAPTVGGATVIDYAITMLSQDVPGISVGLIQNYAQFRAVIQSPDPGTNPTGTAPLSIFTSVFDDGTVQDDHLLTELADENDDIPYNQTEYIGKYGTNCENVCTLPPISTGQITRGKGGVFPCGLIEIQGTLEYEAELTIHLVPGPARGYMTQPMTDM